MSFYETKETGFEENCSSNSAVTGNVRPVDILVLAYFDFSSSMSLNYSSCLKRSAYNLLASSSCYFLDLGGISYIIYY